ncbi:MAG: M28 family metallopeptidase [Cryomorphaceae bacterium]|nr:M28 family peptidase [Flavobacteriales bacterium]
MKYYATLVLVFLAPLFIIAQSDSEKAMETVSKNGVEAKVKFLASDEMKGRETPSPEQNLAAKYLATHLLENGATIPEGMSDYFQTVRLQTSSAALSGTLNTGDESFSLNSDFVVLSSGPANAEGEFIFLGYGGADDFAGVDVKDKLVVVKAGTAGEKDARTAIMESSKKRKRAAEGGATGLVELYIFPQPNWKLITYYFGSSQMSIADTEGDDGADLSIPHIWIDAVSSEKREFFESLSGEGSLVVDASEKNVFTAKNVMGMVAGTDPKLKDEYIIFSAHYDHVGYGDTDANGDSIFNGTRDNAIGTAAVMEAVENIAKYPLKRSALFVYFTAEEKGLLGSEWYVNNPVVPLEKTVMSYNCDNGGYNDTTFAMIVGMSKMDIGKAMAEACETFGLEAKPDQVLDQSLFTRSDHYSFARKGIPGVMYSMGATAFDEEIMKYLHQQADNPNSVDYNYLHKFVRSYVLGGRILGNAKKSPYWKKGSEFHELGESLYNP